MLKFVVVVAALTLTSGEKNWKASEHFRILTEGFTTECWTSNGSILGVYDRECFGFTVAQQYCLAWWIYWLFNINPGLLEPCGRSAADCKDPLAECVDGRCMCPPDYPVWFFNGKNTLSCKCPKPLVNGECPIEEDPRPGSFLYQ